MKPETLGGLGLPNLQYYFWAAQIRNLISWSMERHESMWLQMESNHSNHCHSPFLSNKCILLFWKNDSPPSFEIFTVFIIAFRYIIKAVNKAVEKKKTVKNDVLVFQKLWCYEHNGHHQLVHSGVFSLVNGKLRQITFTAPVNVSTGSESCVFTEM